MNRPPQSKQALDLFGEWIIRQVRDPAIEDADRIIEGHSAPAYKLLSDQLQASLTQEQRDLVKRLVPEIVDSMLHHLLWGLEQTDAVEMAVHAGNETVANIVEASDGLSGEPYGQKGWTLRFSKERFSETNK